MGNVFINIPVPAANGSGAATDVSTMGALKTIIVAGGADASITIEISNEAVASQWAPVKTFRGNGELTVPLAARWMRATVSDYQGGTPVCNVGATDDGCSFLNVVVPAGNGVGADADATALGPYKTITVGGPFRGQVIIEASEDGGTTWAQMMTFQRPGQQTKAFPCSEIRCRRTGIPAGAAATTPIINVGADNTDNPFPDFGNPTIQRYTATGAEGTDFTITLTTPRASDAYSVWPTQAGMASIVGIDCPDLIAGDRTVTDFRVVLTAALTLGDIIDFLIADR